MLRPPLILAYHGISRVEPRYDASRLFVTPQSFRAQVERVMARGYEFVQMSEFARRLDAGESLQQTCALTFDDGPQDNYEVLRPLLKSWGVPGTIYLCPGLLGERYPWLEPAANVRMMTADEVRELAREPLIELGSHTVEHGDLSDASFEDALKDMVESKAALEELIGAPVLSFAYPRCQYSPQCPPAARQAGYTSAVTCEGKGAMSPFELQRVIIHTPDGAVTFAVKALGLYWSVRRLPPVRAARWLTRPYRHRAERSG